MCVPLLTKHISLVVFPTQEKHTTGDNIPRNHTVPPPKQHISLAISVSLSRKHTLSDMCSLTQEITILFLVKCVPLPRKHIPLMTCAPLPGKDISLHIPGDMCSPSLETQGQIVGARESLNGRKNMAQRKVKNSEKSPWGQCLPRPVPNGRRHSAF